MYAWKKLISNTTDTVYLPLCLTLKTWAHKGKHYIINSSTHKLQGEQSVHAHLLSDEGVNNTEGYTHNCMDDCLCLSFVCVCVWLCNCMCACVSVCACMCVWERVLNLHNHISPTEKKPPSALPVTSGNKGQGLFYVSSWRAAIFNHLGEEKREILSGALRKLSGKEKKKTPPFHVCR